MTADRDARLYELFVAAVALPAAERAALLERTRGADPTLHAEVVKLLGHNDAATQGPFLATPLVVPLEPDDASTLVGRRVGPFELREHLASGGMGRVFKAVRVDDYSQSVAVKLLRPGLFSGASAWRFLQERQLLASLDHPHIARLLDGGTTDDGQPYLAIEFIDGRPINRYCAEGNLSPRQRLELFRQVCLAVHHAHQRLVIHRDLKPANVLVTGDGRPKVLDFGIARPLDVEPSTKEGTHTGQVLGTPAYMSPEQAAGDPAAHDIRTDVYSLGVIGYELLAGHLPYDLSGKTLLEQLRIVAEQEPTPLGRANRACRGDLETVFAKALEKDKTRRYSSAFDLAADVERYLTDQPIQARPPRLLYVLGKFVRRNRALTAGLAAAVVALTVGAIATGLALDSARKERDAKEKLLVESHIQLARLQVQRGEWEPALENFGKALAADPPNRAQLRLERAKVLGVLQRAAEAEQELNALAGPENQPVVRAAALLWLGDLRLGLFSEEALKLIGQGRDLGLPDAADRAFAAGLLAKTSEQGLTHFQEAVQADPAHRRANEMLFLTLMTLGRRTEAAERLAVLQAAYPCDKTTILCSAILAVYDPDPEVLKARLEACREHLAPDDFQALTLGLTTLRSFLEVEGWTQAQTLEAMGKIMAEANRLTAHRPSANGTGQRLVMPPALERSVGRVFTVFQRHSFLQLMFDKKPLIAALAEATAAHPEGTLFYILGRLHYDRRDYRAARVALEKAVQMPAIIRVRRSAQEFLLETEVQLIGGPNAFTKEQRPLLLNHLRTFVADGGIKAGNAGNLTILARALGDRELALWIAVEKVKQAPQDAIAHGAVASLELQGGNYGRAVELFERALALNPKDEGLRNELQKALTISRDKFREQVTRLLP